MAVVLPKISNGKNMRMWKFFGMVGVMMMLGGCETAPTSPRPSPGGEGGNSPALTGTPSWRGNEDSIREYYERMELWEALHGGMSEMEGFK